METWLIYALLGACAAALTNIFVKIGTQGIDSDAATVIRSGVATLYLIGFTTYMGKWHHIKQFSGKAMLWIVLAGIAGASSWLFQFRALSQNVEGIVAKVSAIDKLSVPIAVVLAVILLKERLATLNWLGVVLIVAGAYLVAYKPAAS